MNVSQIQRMQQVVGTDGPYQLPTPQQPSHPYGPGPDFGDTLNDAINRVDESQKLSNEQIESFVAGETDDLHGVMIQMNQAKVHFELMTQVRNKALSAYQELMSMQI